jgi:hypothetical protein
MFLENLPPYQFSYFIVWLFFCKEFRAKKRISSFTAVPLISISDMKFYRCAHSTLAAVIEKILIKSVSHKDVDKGHTYLELSSNIMHAIV